MQTIVLLVIAIPALLLPVRHWMAAGLAIARASRFIKPRQAGTTLSRITRFLPHDASNRLVDRITARHVQENMIYARLYWRPAWRPRLDAEGLELLAAATARGGVVLWCVNQTTSIILLKVLLHDAGYTLHHMRSWAHGPTPTRYGRRVINPLFWRTEERYARHLVVHPRGYSALRAAGRVLRDGGIVSFRGIGNGDAPAVMPLLGGWIKLALGAPRTARRHNASLIAVHCRPAGPGAWRFTFTPLGQRAGNGVESVTEEFRILCEHAFSGAPELWPARHRQFLTATA